MTDLLGIAGSISSPSNTRTAVEVAVNAARQSFNITTDILHLADYHLANAGSQPLAEYSGDTETALQRIINSNAFIIGTPVYRGSYSGALKNLFDLIPRGKWQADEAPLENRPIGFIATGATNHHFLSLSQEMGPIASFFGSYPVGSGVYVKSSTITDGTITDADIINRLRTLGKAVAELSTCIDQSDYLSALGPQF